MTTTFDPYFDHVYRLDANGTITDGDGYAPDVENDPECDVLVDYIARRDTKPYDGDWDVLIDHSGQDRYHGAVMHPSEQWGQWAIDDLADMIDEDPEPGAVSAVEFAVVEVRDDDGDYPDGDPIGWAVAYRLIHYPAAATAAGLDY